MAYIYKAENNAIVEIASGDIIIKKKKGEGLMRLLKRMNNGAGFHDWTPQFMKEWPTSS